MAKAKNHGVFSKDGVVMTAHTAEDAVRMRYDGWLDQAEEEKRAAAAPADEQPADDGDTKPAKKSR